MNAPGGLPFASVRTLLMCLLAALLAAACGQRGPLYLPQPESQAPPSTQPVDADEEAPGKEDRGEENRGDDESGERQ